jgi:hypothetical protein
MEINQSLLDQDLIPSASHASPNSDATEFFPDNPNSAYQCFGPPDLDKWLPESGATSHYTPVFSDLCDVQSCHVPVSLADKTTKTSTFKGTIDCYFTTLADPSYFDLHDKHNQWLRLPFFVDGMLYVGSNDSIEKNFQ